MQTLSRKLHFDGVLTFIFLYFLTLSADLININISFFQLKLSHLIASAMFLFLLCLKRSIVIEKRFFFCFLFILSSFFISSLFSLNILRSMTYCSVYVFTYAVYFLVPFSLLYFGDEKKILNLYLISYLCIGTYAAMQFFASIGGVILPFVVQHVVYARGSAFAHEPSFYALYAIPFVAYLNTKRILLSESEPVRLVEGIVLFLANLFLLVSTTTTAFLFYIVLFFILFTFSYLKFVRTYFCKIRKTLARYVLYFSMIFAGSSLLFFELFKKTFLKYFYFGFFTHESFFDRFKGILLSLSVFCEYPLFGVGLGGVAPYLYKRTLYGDREGALFDYTRLSIQALEPTNVFSEMLGSLGLYGFCAFAILLYLVWKCFRRFLAGHNISRHERINVLSLLISLVVMMICLQINMGFFRSYVWVHLGVSMGYVLKNDN
jgi:hypothetical protein